MMRGDRRAVRRAASLAACLAVPLALGAAGCGTGGLFGPGVDEPRQVSARAPATELSYPNLATVPERPVHTPTRRSERQRILRELMEDQGEAEFVPRETSSAPGSAPSALNASRVIMPAGGWPVGSAPGEGRPAATIHFAHGSAALTDHDRGVLREVARRHAERGGGVRIIGHASSRVDNPVDPVAYRLANFEVSMDRAEAVAEALAAMGVSRAAMTLEARGDRDPVYHEFMSTGEAGNRRVEVRLTP